MNEGFVDSGNGELVPLMSLVQSDSSIPFEHERRFFLTQKELLLLPFNFSEYPYVLITQGYLEDTLKTRIRDEETKKGNLYLQTRKSGGGMSRLEDERKISKDEFDSMWHAVGASLQKRRYFIRWNSRTVELNIFHGKLDGYLQIEVEFPTEEDALAFLPPAWMGIEVTNNPHHGNYQLAKNGIPSEMHG